MPLRGRAVTAAHPTGTRNPDVLNLAPPDWLQPGNDAAVAFAADTGAFISATDFWSAVAALRVRLTGQGEVVNLCESRLRFVQLFAAALLRRRTTLLPASHAPQAIAELIGAYPGCVTLGDAQTAAVATEDVFPTAEPPPDFVAAIGHTSGSTGRPAAYAKAWGGFCATTALNAEAIRATLPESTASQRPWIVATVPPQHMYGLEMTVLLPLLAGFGIHGGRPLMPADVAAALGQVPPPRVLVSTPVHLRTLVESGVTFPDVAVVVSATAPLSQRLAQQLEQHMHASLLEMFGSTETCVVATRRTAQQARWHTYPGIELEPIESGTLVRAPWLPREQLLHDIVELHDDRSFTVIGRHGDLVEIAGKRASLADLTRRLGGLPGVEDAVVFQAPAGREGEIRRCAALVVAPGHSAREIARRFREQVDAAFVPRPLVVVPSLPRNELGKLPLNQLLRLLAEARSR